MTSTNPPPSLRSRILGALLAHHSGDSLGATLEFKSAQTIRRQYPQGLRDIIGGGSFGWKAGDATDDSDMTRGVLRAYHRVITKDSTEKKNPTHRSPNFGEQTDIATVAGCFFLDWLHGDDWPGRISGSGPEDIGNATFVGLSRFRDGGYDVDKAGAGQGSAGNGSLMRCIPTGLIRWEDETQTEAERQLESVRISSVTHDDHRCVVACAVYNTIVARLLQGSDAGKAVQDGLLLAKEMEKKYVGSKGTVAASLELGIKLSSVEDVAEKGPTQAQFSDMCGGYVIDSLTLSVAAVLDPRSLEDVLVDVVRVGRDTDTNGAIAGGLLGARDGEAAIPERWKSKLQFREEYTKLVGEIMVAKGWK